MTLPALKFPREPASRFLVFDPASNKLLKIHEPPETGYAVLSCQRFFLKGWHNFEYYELLLPDFSFVHVCS
jgi:hypothetical protein